MYNSPDRTSRVPATRRPRVRPSRPPRAIFTTSGWPLLTHHGRPLSTTGFSSWVKNDNRDGEGCEVSHRNEVEPPICSPLSRRASRAPMASQRGESTGCASLFLSVSSPFPPPHLPLSRGQEHANKNARKKGDRGWHYALLAASLSLSLPPNNNGRRTFRVDVDSYSAE